MRHDGFQRVCFSWWEVNAETHVVDANEAFKHAAVFGSQNAKHRPGVLTCEFCWDVCAVGLNLLWKGTGPGLACTWTDKKRCDVKLWELNSPQQRLMVMWLQRQRESTERWNSQGPSDPACSELKKCFWEAKCLQEPNQIRSSLNVCYFYVFRMTSSWFLKIQRTPADRKKEPF